MSKTRSTKKSARASTLKKKAATPSQTPPPNEDPPAPAVTPAELAAKLGASSEDEVRVVLDDPTHEQLLAEGRSVETPRISREGVRIYKQAAAFLTTSAPTLRRVVRLSPEVIRIGAWCLAQGDATWAQHRGAVSSERTQTRVNDAQAERTLGAARQERNQLAGALRSVAGRDVDWGRRIAAAVQPAASGQAETSPAAALDALVPIGREMLQRGDVEVTRRCELFGLTAEWLDDCEALAAKTRAAVQRAEERSRAKVREVTVDDVNLWDGLNLMLLDRVVRAFNTAHAKDPMVPRLEWIELATWAGVRRAKRSANEAEPTPAPKPEPSGG